MTPKLKCLCPSLIASASVLWVTPARAQNAGVPRPFPDTRYGTFVFADQLPSQITEARRRFIASHYVEGQKQTRAWIRSVRRINPRYLLLHYQLAVGAGPAPFVDGGAGKTGIGLVPELGEYAKIHWGTFLST